MLLPLVTLVLAGLASSIRVPVWPAEGAKSSAPYGIAEQTRFEDLRSVSSSGRNNERYSGNSALRHDNPETRRSFLVPPPPPGAIVIFHDAHQRPSQNFKHYAHPVRKTYKDNEHQPTATRRTSVNEHHSAPITNHEIPREVPTKPVYPGEGKWAKKNQQYLHKNNIKNPKLTQTKYPKPQEAKYANKLYGHDVFDDTQQTFDKQQQHFAHELDQLSHFAQNAPEHQSPPSHKNNHNIIEKQAEKVKEDVEEQVQNERAESNSSVENEDQQEEEEDDEYEQPAFIPLKTYSQVRRSEDVEHLPRIVIEPKLREVIRDSKIQTVYTEEGYEDSEYDHEGHEKNAEQSEGHAEASKSKKPTKKFINTNRFQELKKDIETDAAKIVDKHFSDDRKPDTAQEKEEDEDSDTQGSNRNAMKLMMKKLTVQKQESLHRRRKRFVNDFPEIGPDTAFIHNINLNLPPKQVKKNKYPYYSAKVNENSPLRYAEDLENAPVKIGGEMSFYEHADRYECPEVESDVNPVPEGRIQKAETEETGESDTSPKTPRLGSLGDKIDCFKAKYFGEEPLDSPIFQEELIDQPKPIDEFNEIRRFFKLPTENYVKPKQSNFYLKPNHQIELIASAENHEAPREYVLNQAIRDSREDDVRIENASKNSDNKKSVLPKNTGNNDASKEDAINEDASTEVVKDEDAENASNKYASKENDRNKYSLKEDTRNEYASKEDTKSEERIKEETTRKTSTKDADDSKSAEVTTENAPIKDDYSEDTYANEETENHPSSPNKDEYYYDESLEEYKTIADDYVEQEERPVISHQIASIEKIDADAFSDNSTTPKSRTSKASKLDVEINLKETNATKPDLKAAEGEEDVSSNSTAGEQLPEQLPFRRRKFRVKRPYYSQPYPSYKVFDVNPYIPAVTSFPVLTTVKPKYKTISEVYYKDEIKPDEQLNVFADVMNIIKNSTRDSDLSPSDNVEPVSVKLNTKKHEVSTEYKPVRRRKKNPATTTTEAYELETQDMIKNYYQTSTNSPRKKAEDLYNDFMVKLKEYHKNAKDDEVAQNIFKNSAKEQEKIHQNYLPKNKVAPQISNVAQTSGGNVYGLTPPVYEEKNAQLPSDQSLLNIYYVIGMKPPPRIRPISYSDYQSLSTNKVRRKASSFPKRRRYKRDTSNRNYAAISRGKDDAKSAGEVEDDYEPNRHRSFHYDEKTGKIVYDKKAEPPVEYEEIEEEEEEPEIDYGGLIPLKEPLPLSKKKVTTEGPPTTPGIDFSIDRKNQFNYLDYVNKLKSNKEYVLIPDPTTTERGATTSSTSPAPMAKTTPPEFLNILAKLHSDNGYKSIKDKDEKKSKTSSTQKPEEDVEEEEEEEEEPLKGIRNSPGGSQSGNFANLQIFDISDYLPQVKTYAPRTSIDTSKYKSIDRSQSRLTTIEELETTPRNVVESKPTTEVSDSKGYASIRRQRPQSGNHILSSSTKAPEVAEEQPEAAPKRAKLTGKLPEVAPEAPERVPAVTVKPSESTTSKRRILIRNRTRGTTASTERTTQVPETPRTRQRKPTRTFSRRQRVRIHTTQSPETVSKERVQRRIRVEADPGSRDQRIPVNHKEVYTPIVVPENVEELLELNLETQITGPRVITPEIVAANQTSVSNPDVEVFAAYDQTKKHGGNYKKAEQATRTDNLDSKQSQIVAEVVNNKEQEAEVVPAVVYEIDGRTDFRQLIDIIPKPFAYYPDRRLPSKINLLKERSDDGLTELIEIEEEQQQQQQQQPGNGEEFYDDGVEIKFEQNQVVSSTRRPAFVKDPSKRLYFYAPL